MAGLCQQGDLVAHPATVSEDHRAVRPRIRRSQYMLVRIAVADPLPVFRRGVMEILREAGYEPEAPDDLLAWARDEQTRAVVITVGCDADWHLLEALHRSPAEVVVVALLDQMSVAGSVRAFRAG